ncbi:MAG: ComEA family DNA-binding protein [Spirulina sp. SIO3F2]|nr:ComEA family DNA-binding protein [Spirulina sp. SIO3F2]
MAHWLSPFRQVQQALNPSEQHVRQQLQQNPYYRLQSWAEIPIAADWGLRIEVNLAEVDDWLRLPGISIHQARSLVALTSSGGQLLCLDDLAAALSLPLARVQPLAPLLSFSYYDPEGLENPQRFNPNTTTLAELEQIPLLTERLAQRIFTERQTHGPYRDIADLQQRLAFSGYFTTQLMYYLRF